MNHSNRISMAALAAVFVSPLARPVTAYDDLNHLPRFTRLNSDGIPRWPHRRSYASHKRDKAKAKRTR